MVVDVGRGTRIGVVVLVAASAPGALALETFLRRLILPPEFDDVREFFGPAATDAAWFFAASCVLAALVGVAAQRRWCRDRMRRAREDGDDPTRAAMDRTFLAMSIPQVPAILATVAFMSGAELRPVLVAMAISTLGVLAQGVQWEALLAAARREDSA
jgi:hypothetical protein